MSPDVTRQEPNTAMPFVGSASDIAMAETPLPGLAGAGFSIESIGGLRDVSRPVIGLTPGPNNAWGDTYVIVQVQISEHQNVADVADY